MQDSPVAMADDADEEREHEMKIAVVGTGAMGSVYAALLRRAGHEVWAVDPWQAHLDAMARTGLSVSGASGSYVVTGLRVARTPSDVGPTDLWIVATKAQDVATVATQIAPLLRPDSMVMAFQNGLGAGERVAAHIPAKHVLVGIAEGFGSSIPEPGRVHHEGMRLIRIGELSGGLTDRLRHLEQVWCEAGFNVKAFDDLTLMIWEKFLCNVTLSAPTAVFDCTVGELMAERESWIVALDAMLEAHRLGLALGVSFPFDDPVRYVTDFAATIPDASPSMRLDHLAHRHSEIDVINGAVVDRSPGIGLEAPVNKVLCAVVRARESRFP